MFDRAKSFPSKYAFAVSMAVASVLAPLQASAAAGDFYRDKVVTHVVMTRAGGMYDLYSRLFIEHVGKYLPGKPKFIMKYMPGAGGLKGTNYIYNVAAKDGSSTGMAINDLAITQILRPNDVKFDARQFNWIGRMNVLTQAVMVNAGIGVNSIDDAKKKEVIMGGFGKNSNDYKIAQVLNSLVGTKINLVLGYRGSARVHLAMEKGEVYGRIGSWMSVALKRPHLLKENKLKILAQSGIKPQPGLSNVPLLIDLVKKPEDKRIMEFIDAGTLIGWSILMPPGVPAERVAAMRKAYGAMFADPAFLAAAKKREVPLDHASGTELEAVVERTLSMPAPLVARTKKVIGY